MARDMFRAAGRQSLPWRIGQDLKTLPIIQDRLVIGHARWDWFRGAGTRPWGMPLLLLGQFGLVGLLGLLAALGCAFYRSEEHTSELQSLMRISYAGFCLKTKNIKTQNHE